LVPTAKPAAWDPRQSVVDDDANGGAEDGAAAVDKTPPAKEKKKLISKDPNKDIWDSGLSQMND
jgi:hypothetical protein